MNELTVFFKTRPVQCTDLDPDIPGHDGKQKTPGVIYYPVDSEGNTLQHSIKMKGIEVEGKLYGWDYIRSHLINDEE